MKSIRIISLVLISLLALAVVVVATGFRWNWTDSAPTGLWRVTGSKAMVGDSVFICPPSLVWIKNLVDQNHAAPGYCPSGTVPFIKKVAALGGDSFRITLHGVLVNDELINNSKPMRSSYISTKREGIVEEGAVLLVSTYHPNSIDSRYFGPLSLKDSNAQTIVPVWIW